LEASAISACALIAVIALSTLLYEYLANKGSRAVGGAVIASSRQLRGVEDIVMADLKPGVDGGSSAADLPFALQRQVVFYRTTVVPGSIVVDRENRFLYLINANNSARRYGIGIAQECLKGGSFFHITSKLEWPDWRPPGADAAKDAPTLLAATGRPGSPLGARALLLDKPGLIIHGTNTPKTIGHLVASGCIRLVNDDVQDLYRRVSLESRVVFVS
jgi:lipoprotein-anchoring transpeptidase ErfK/SrfK